MDSPKNLEEEGPPTSPLKDGHGPSPLSTSGYIGSENVAAFQSASQEHLPSEPSKISTFSAAAHKLPEVQSLTNLSYPLKKLQVELTLPERPEVSSSGNRNTVDEEGRQAPAGVLAQASNQNFQMEHVSSESCHFQGAPQTEQQSRQDGVCTAEPLLYTQGSCSVWIGKIDLGVQRSQVLDVFSQFGEICRLTGPRFHRIDGIVHGWAIVNFAQQQSACLASWTFQAGNVAVAAEMWGQVQWSSAGAWPFTALIVEWKLPHRPSLADITGSTQHNAQPELGTVFDPSNSEREGDIEEIPAPANRSNEHR
ncbi:hypothetical protein WJX75_004365 [Coccomyxa subellipsoidea]|uniref:RRM domain-containing protein n=1 Tax=Coccomyxa subellipsoidea TaxID=248742 RepID=A0ABR2YJA5_9CHLO